MKSELTLLTPVLINGKSVDGLGSDFQEASDAIRIGTGATGDALAALKKNKWKGGKMGNYDLTNFAVKMVCPTNEVSTIKITRYICGKSGKV